MARRDLYKEKRRGREEERGELSACRACKREAGREIWEGQEMDLTSFSLFPRLEQQQQSLCCIIPRDEGTELMLSPGTAGI